MQWRDRPENWRQWGQHKYMSVLPLISGHSPRMTTKTITMTDMKWSSLLIATPLHAGNRGVEAAGKTWARRPPGENKLSLMGKKSWVFLPPYTPHFYDHIISFPLWAFLFFFLSADFSGRNIEEMYIRFMVISPAERCTSAATAAPLRPVPAGFWRIAWLWRRHLKGVNRSPPSRGVKGFFCRRQRPHINITIINQHENIPALCFTCFTCDVQLRDGDNSIITLS